MAQTVITIQGLTTTEKYFDHFEIEIWDSSHTNRLGVTEVQGTFSTITGQYSQTDLAQIPGATLGDLYNVRSRVIDKYGNGSAWSNWIDVVANNSSTPVVTYTPSSSPSSGGILIFSNPVTIDVDIDHYEFYWNQTNTAPSGTQTPNLPNSPDGSVQILSLQTKTAYVWVRAVNTSGATQAWTSLGSFTSTSAPASQPPQGFLIDSAAIAICREDFHTTILSSGQGFASGVNPLAQNSTTPGTFDYPYVGVDIEAIPAPYAVTGSQLQGWKLGIGPTEGWFRFDNAIFWEMMVIFKITDLNPTAPIASIGQSGLTRSANTATLTLAPGTSSAHNLNLTTLASQGNPTFTVSGSSDPSFNGPMTINGIPSATSITFPNPGPDVSVGTAGGGSLLWPVLYGWRIAMGLSGGSSSNGIKQTDGFYGLWWEYGKDAAYTCTVFNNGLQGNSFGSNALDGPIGGPNQGFFAVDFIKLVIGGAPDTDWHRLRIWSDSRGGLINSPEVHTQLDDGNIRTWDNWIGTFAAFGPPTPVVPGYSLPNFPSYANSAVPPSGLLPQWGMEVFSANPSGPNVSLPKICCDYFHFGFINTTTPVNPASPRWFAQADTEQLFLCGMDVHV